MRAKCCRNNRQTNKGKFHEWIPLLQFQAGPTQQSEMKVCSPSKMVPEHAGVVKSCLSGSWDIPVLEQHCDLRLTSSPLAQGCTCILGTPEMCGQQWRGSYGLWSEQLSDTSSACRGRRDRTYPDFLALLGNKTHTWAICVQAWLADKFW